VSLQENEGSAEQSNSPIRRDNLTIRLLWIGLAIYIVIVFNSVRYVRTVPYYALVSGSLINLATIFSFIYALGRNYKRRTK
jgi:hypothetical protein